MSLTNKVCLFCQSELTGTRTREHIIPQWLLDHLDIRDMAISPVHAGPDGSIVSVRKHKLADLKEGRICATCNNGWMSRLESSVQPILISLMHAQRATVDLTRPERDILAHWTMKTAFLLNSASNYRNVVPHQHFYALAHDNHARLPANILVVAQQHNNTEQFYWLQSSTWHLLNTGRMKSTTLDKLVAQSYKITLQFGQLILLVAHWPHNGWIPGLWRGIHVSMWPPSGPCIFHEAKNDFPWNNSTYAIINFNLGLAMYREKKQI